MSQPTPQVLQTYTLLQIAAETFLGTTRAGEPAALPGDARPVQLSVEKLKEGNDHSSRMTQTQAEQFAREWKVLSHQPNTATGFSATLFECLVADPARGMFVGQKVVSFRSTEFIEDHARDNHATNQMEISQAGWAFGQLADMRLWWASVQPLVGAAKVDVTGYSLGGHLATAFQMLHSAQVDEVYTFNGAGVGKVKSGNDLASVLSTFETRRRSGNADLFSDAVALAEYQRLAPLFSETSNVNRATADGALSAVRAKLAEARVDNRVTGGALRARIDQLALLESAMSHAYGVRSRLSPLPPLSYPHEPPPPH